jgi:DNA polymerase III epsilon subunit-like protein
VLLSTVAWLSLGATWRLPACSLLEFGALVVDGNSLVEDPRLSFETLVRPDDLKAITKRSIDCNHITDAMVAQAPEFHSVAQQIFDVLDGRIWLGHNIVRFDIPQLTRQFELAGLPAPQPAGVIDTLPLLREHFGKRAGDMKMASLGRFFGQGEEEHRALADARMTMEVVKHAGALLFLEERSAFAALEPEREVEPEREREGAESEEKESPPHPLQND